MSVPPQRPTAALLLRWRAFLDNSRGSTAIVFSLVVPVVIAAAGVSIDYISASRLKAVLQAAADAGATAGARELTLGSITGVQATEVAIGVAKGNLQQRRSGGDFDINATLTQDKAGVDVKITQAASAFFDKVLGVKPTVVAVRAIASSTSKNQKICVLGLDETAGSTVSLESNARLTAENCGVYSNSKSSSGLSSLSNALMTAQLICTAGGKTGGKGNFSPDPITDCPLIPDPLAGRAAPSVGPCKEVSLVLKEGNYTLSPGTYCNGLTIDTNAKVTMSPGVYIMKDGPLVVDSNGELTGDYVGVFFTGKNAYLRFNSDAVVTLGAPKEGPMAGLLFFEDRNNTGGTKFIITSNYTRNLLGTIYLPKGQFSVDANNPVADKSAFTVIVATRIELNAGPNLVINSNYGGTDVPVPQGVGPVGGKIRLIQ